MTSTEQLRSIKTGNAFTFEAITCGRCGGTGHYSFNQMHGSRCYGCGGHGIKLTKRGDAAQRYYRELLSKPAERLAQGDRIYAAGGPMWVGGWAEVQTVEADGERINIKATMCKSGEGYNLSEFPGTTHRVAASAERKAEAKAEALAYQATLTKAGTPRKRTAS